MLLEHNESYLKGRKRVKIFQSEARKDSKLESINKCAFSTECFRERKRVEATAHDLSAPLFDVDSDIMNQ